jgi:predicted nucleotidyltransferase
MRRKGERLMKPIKTFCLPFSMRNLGKEWEGVYTICQLNVREYFSALEEAQATHVPEGYAITIKSIKHNGQHLDLNSEIPCKLYEVLSAFSLPLNLVDKYEASNISEILPEKQFVDSERIVTVKEIEPVFNRFKSELTAKFPEIKKVELFGGLVNRKQTDHDIDVFIELDLTTKRFSEITAEIFQLSILFPLPLETHIKIGSCSFIQREKDVLIFGFG